MVAGFFIHRINSPSCIQPEKDVFGRAISLQTFIHITFVTLEVDLDIE